MSKRRRCPSPKGKRTLGRAEARERAVLQARHDREHSLAVMALYDAFAPPPGRKARAVPPGNAASLTAAGK